MGSKEKTPKPFSTFPRILNDTGKTLQYTHTQQCELDWSFFHRSSSWREDIISWDKTTHPHHMCTVRLANSSAWSLQVTDVKWIRLGHVEQLVAWEAWVDAQQIEKLKDYTFSVPVCVGTLHHQRHLTLRHPSNLCWFTSWTRNSHSLHVGTHV